MCEKEAMGGTEIFVSHETRLGRKGRNCVDTSARQQPEQLQELSLRLEWTQSDQICADETP